MPSSRSGIGLLGKVVARHTPIASPPTVARGTRTMVRSITVPLRLFFPTRSPVTRLVWGTSISAAAATSRSSTSRTGLPPTSLQIVRLAHASKKRGSAPGLPCTTSTLPLTAFYDSPPRSRISGVITSRRWQARRSGSGTSRCPMPSRVQHYEAWVSLGVMRPCEARTQLNETWTRTAFTSPTRCQFLRYRSIS